MPFRRRLRHRRAIRLRKWRKPVFLRSKPLIRTGIMWRVATPPAPCTQNRGFPCDKSAARHTSEGETKFGGSRKMLIAWQAPQIFPPMIPFCSRSDSGLFTPKMPAIAGCFNFSRSPLVMTAPFSKAKPKSNTPSARDRQ